MLVLHRKRSMTRLAERHDYAEPFEDEVLESYVGHVGSCNSDEGCYLSTSVRVNPRVQYRATLRAAQIDMEQDSEKLSFVTLAGRDMGNSAEFCNCYIILFCAFSRVALLFAFSRGTLHIPITIALQLDYPVIVLGQLSALTTTGLPYIDRQVPRFRDCFQSNKFVCII